jgi:hypothetical protein
MESQGFDPKAYAVSPIALIPPNDCEDEDDNQWWRAYCRVASTLDRTPILAVVLSDLDAEDSPLCECIDDAIANPHEPGRPKANITALARLGQSLLNRIAEAVDDQVNLRMAVREVPHDSRLDDLRSLTRSDCARRHGRRPCRPDACAAG